MTKNLTKISFLVLVAGFLLPVFCFASALFDYWNASYNNSDTFSVDHFRGETFTASQTYKLTSVKVFITRSGDPQVLTLSIQETSGGLPTGVELCSGTTAVPDSYSWVEITCGSGADLTKDQKYALILKYPLGSGTDKITWAYQNANSYPSGDMLDTYDAGSNWTAYGGADFTFETWGDLPVAPVSHILTIPTNAGASILTFTGRLFTDLENWIVLAIGLPVAFYILHKAINLPINKKK